MLLHHRRQPRWARPRRKHLPVASSSLQRMQREIARPPFLSLHRMLPLLQLLPPAHLDLAMCQHQRKRLKTVR